MKKQETEKYQLLWANIIKNNKLIRTQLFSRKFSLFVIAILIIIPKIQERRKMLYEKSNRKNLKLSAKINEKLAVKSCGATSMFDSYQPKIPDAVKAMTEKNKTK